MAPTEPGPTVRHRQLAAELRRLRETEDLSQADAARAFGWDRSKLVKIETAKVMPSVRDVGIILEAYGGDAGTRAQLLELARTIRQRGYWSAYGGPVGAYAELEQAASRIRSCQVQLVPGLLQTEDYARVLIQRDVADPAEADERLRMRMQRQAKLAERDARIEVILTEEVLRRPVGGDDVMQGQLEALVLACGRPNVKIQVLPIAVGLFPAIGQGSIVIFEFPGPMDLSVAYLETVSGGMYVEDVKQVRSCNVTFDNIASAALPPKESSAFLAALARE